MLLERRPDKYKLMVDQLLKKCEEIQSDNSRLVMRINNVKKQVRRRTRDVGLLKRRLDRYNDNWRMLPVVVPHPKRKIEQKRGPKPKIKDPKEPPKERKPRKQRAKKIVVATTPQVVANPRTTPAVLPTYIPKTSSVAIFNIRRPPNLPGSTTIHAHPPGHHPKPMYHQLHQQKPLQKHAAKLFQSLQRPPPTQHRPLFTEQLSKLLQKNQHITIKH